jgi:hypothetical protein
MVIFNKACSHRVRSRRGLSLSRDMQGIPENTLCFLVPGYVGRKRFITATGEDASAGDWIGRTGRS